MIIGLWQRVWQWLRQRRYWGDINKAFKVVAIDTVQGKATLFCRGRGATFTLSIGSIVDDSFIMSNISSQHACWLGYCLSKQRPGGGAQFLNRLCASSQSQCCILQRQRDGELVCYDQKARQHFVVKPSKLARSKSIVHFSNDEAFYIGLLAGDTVRQKKAAAKTAATAVHCYVKQGGGMSVIWDAHACPTLEPDCDLSALQDYHRLGYHYVSLNAGFDPQTAGDIKNVLVYYNDYIRMHAGNCVVAKSAADILAAKKKNKLAVGFDIEGLSAFADDPVMAEVLKSLGVNQATLAYNQNNTLAGGCQGSSQGVTQLGFKWIEALNNAGIILDCSHMSKKSSLDTIEASSQPVVFSHSNPLALHQHERNIDDIQIKACAAKGGVIGVNGISLFLKNESIDAKNIVDHIDYIVQLVGVDHVGWGSDFVFEHEKTLALIEQFPQDFPNAAQYLRVKVAQPSVLFEVKNALAKKNYDNAMLDKIIGGNFFRVASQAWSAND